MSPGVAKFHITKQLLIEALRLPTGTVIHSVDDIDQQVIEIEVSHPDIPDRSPIGRDWPPLAKPSFRKQEPVVFEGWGVE